MNNQQDVGSVAVEPPLQGGTSGRLTPVMHIVTFATGIVVASHVVRLINLNARDGWSARSAKLWEVTGSVSVAAGLLFFAAALYLASISSEPTVKKSLRLFGWAGIALQVLSFAEIFYLTGWRPGPMTNLWTVTGALAFLMSLALCTAAWHRTRFGAVALAMVSAVLFASVLGNGRGNSSVAQALGEYGFWAMRVGRYVLYWLLFRAMAKDVTCWPLPLVAAGYRNLVQSLSIRLWLAGVGLLLTAIALSSRSVTVFEWTIPLAMIGGWLAQWWAVAGALRLTFAGTGSGLRAAAGAAILACSATLQFETVASLSSSLLRGSSMRESEIDQVQNFHFLAPIATIIGFLLLASVVSRVAKQRHHLPIQQLIGACCTVYVIATALTIASPFLLRDVRSVAAVVFMMLFIAAAGLVAVVALRRLFKRAYEAIENEEFHVANLPTAVATVRAD